VTTPQAGSGRFAAASTIFAAVTRACASSGGE